MVSSPMFAPRLMPEMIMSGISSSNPVTARWTQSVGVPFTNRKPFADVRTESGRSRVSGLEAPLRSRSGATTVTFARPESASARTAIPGAKYPSSLLSRMRTFTPTLAYRKIRVRLLVSAGTRDAFYQPAHSFSLVVAAWRHQNNQEISRLQNPQRSASQFDDAFARREGRWP